MTNQIDAVVIGAGFAGIYAVHKLRDELGLKVQGFDVAAGPGGTWYWNRYPGARCDIPSVHYSYSFSDEIQREWKWSERYAAQPEILRYLEFAADKLDVRRSFSFNTRVTSVVWNDADSRWTIETDTGKAYTARFVIAAGGNVSIAKSRSEFPGIDQFKGKVLATSNWPHEGFDFAGKRVGVIGTGSTGIQMTPEIARQAKHVTVFQRTPNFAVPLANADISPEEQTYNTENWKQIRDKSRDRFMGVPFESPEPSALAVSSEERRARFDRLWKEGGFRLVVSSYGDILTDERANETVAEYVREKIRERVRDPKVADILCPDDHPYGTKRAAMETDYFDMFNRDNVRLVDIRAAPIEQITETGIRTGGKEHELDVIVLATGFDAITGPLLHLGVVGREGVTLNERWKNGPRSYLGIATAGFPNLFTITGPTSAVTLYNNPLAIEDHVDFASDAIQHVLDHGASTFEADEAAENVWHELVDGLLHLTLFPRANSWYMGANVPGKPRATFMFAGGAPLYRAMVADSVNNGYAGFKIDGASKKALPALIQIDPGVAMVVGAMLMQDTKPLEDCTLDEARAAVESFVMLQKSVPEGVHQVETTYRGAADERRVKIYKPDDVEGPLPVIIFFHGGGFIAGSIDMCAPACAALAKELGVIVVAPSYRLAPEAPFPAATDDTYAAVCWTAENISNHGGNPEQIAVMGDSAGGLLAAVAAQRARDENGPELMAQILLYPAIDAEAKTASRKEFAAGPVLSTAAAQGMLLTYLDDPENAKSPLASPSRASSLKDLPPALILSAECDPLRDEGEDYGRALEAAGTPTQVLRLKGMVHAAYYMSGHVPRVSEFNAAISRFLQPLRNRVAAEA